MRMQPGVTVVLATAWLAVYVVGTSSLHLSHLALDQYSPLPPRHHEVYGGVEDQLDWKDQNPTENQPFDLSIGPRRSISTSTELLKQSSEPKHHRKDYSWTGNSAGHDFLSLVDNKQSHTLVGLKFTDGEVDDRSTKESSPLELPPSELEDPFVADDTFQDQGPGSVEIYKLDLLREKSLLNSTPMTKLLTKSKSKTPKKTSHSSWKTKSVDYKATSPKVLYKQSNSFDDTHTVVPPRSYPFGVGGVPELQVGCEGLEASDQKQKRSINSPRKGKNAGDAVDLWSNVTPISLDLDYDFPSEEEGYEEMDELLKLKKLEIVTEKVKQNRGDMDATRHSEFFDDKRHSEKLPIRGDLGKSNVPNESSLASAMSVGKSLHSDNVKRDVHDEKDQEPVDRSITNHGRKILWLHNIEDQKRSKRAVWGFGEDEGVVSSDELQTENQRRRQDYERRRQDNEKRRQEAEKRRQEAERRRQEEDRRRGLLENQTNSTAESIRNNYEKLLEQRQRENEERERRLQESQRSTPNKSQWEEQRRRLQEEETRRKEERRRQELEESRRRYGSPQSPTDEEDRRRQLEEIRQPGYIENRTSTQPENLRREYQKLLEQKQREDEERQRRLQESQRSTPNNSQSEEHRRRLQEEETRRKEERRRQELEESRRRYGSSQSTMDEEERRRKLQREELRQREETRQREEERKRLQVEEMRRRTQAKWKEEMERRQQQDIDRQNVENRRREWMLKRRQEEEEERRRQERNRTEAPSNLLHPGRAGLNESRPHDAEAERRMREQQERERELKLREYIQHNRPINVNSADRHRDQANRSRLEEEQRRRIEEERKLQEYIRRNQPVQVPKTNESYEYAWLKRVRPIDEAGQNDRSRYPGPDSERRNHGPSAPSGSNPWSYSEEARRRESARRIEEERIRERQRQEQEELRREVLRREEEARRMQSRRYEEQRKRLEMARLDAERERKELMEEEARRSQAGRSRPLENTRPRYEDRQRFEGHRRRQDTSLIPANLLLNDSRRTELERQRQEQERRRMEAERRRQGGSRANEARENDGRATARREQLRRQEEARQNALPVSARIIIRPGGSSPVPNVMSRGGFDNDIDFPRVNPNNGVVKYPGPVTRPRIPAKGPSACVWAVVRCCSGNVNRRVRCFETFGCPGINWAPDPCSIHIIEAANKAVVRSYEDVDASRM